MKIVHITSSFPPFVGGISSAVKSLVRALHSLSVEQSVYVVQKGNSILRTASSTYCDVDVYYHFVPNDYLCQLYVPSLMKKIRRMHKDKVILHFHSATLFSYFVPFLSRPAFPVILTPRTWHVNTIPLRKNLAKRLALKVLLFKFYKKLYAKASTITAITDRELDFIVRYYGIPKEKVMKLIDVSPILFEDIEQYKIKRAILRSTLNIPKDHVVLLFVGRVERLKGIDILLDALSKIEERNIITLIVGPITDKLAITNVTSDVRCKVKYLGPLVGSKLYNIYSIADIFVLPSRLETAPLTILEAQTFGLPIIATNVGDVSEVVGNTGLLVKVGDSFELAEAIKKLVNDYELRTRLGSNCLKRIKYIRVRWAEQVNELIRRYETLINR